MSEVTNEQPAAHADEIADENLEAVSGGLSLYGNTPNGKSLILPVMPVSQPGLEPTAGEPLILVVES